MIDFSPKARQWTPRPTRVLPRLIALHVCGLVGSGFMIAGRAPLWAYGLVLLVGTAALWLDLRRTGQV